MYYRAADDVNCIWSISGCSIVPIPRGRVGEEKHSPSQLANAGGRYSLVPLLYSATILPLLEQFSKLTIAIPVYVQIVYMVT